MAPAYPQKGPEQSLSDRDRHPRSSAWAKMRGSGRVAEQPGPQGGGTQTETWIGPLLQFLRFFEH